MSAGWQAVNDPGPALPGCGHVYVIRVDGRARYIGQTVKSLARRMGAHVKDRSKSYKGNGLRRALTDGRVVTIEPVHINVEHGPVLDGYEVEAIANLMAIGKCWNTNTSAARVDFDNMSPESRAAVLAGCSAGGKAVWQDPEFVAMQSARNRAQWQDPEYVARHSARVRAQWEDPEYVAMHSARVRAKWQDPEFAAMHSAKAKAQWEDPEFAAMQAAKMTAQWQDPEYAAKMSAKAKAQWEDPEFAAKAIAAGAMGARFRPGGSDPYPVGESPQDLNPNNIARKRLGLLWRELGELFLGDPSQYRARNQGQHRNAIGIPILALLDAGWTPEQVIAMGPDVRIAAHLTAGDASTTNRRTA